MLLSLREIVNREVGSSKMSSGSVVSSLPSRSIASRPVRPSKRSTLSEPRLFSVRLISDIPSMCSKVSAASASRELSCRSSSARYVRPLKTSLLSGDELVEAMSLSARIRIFRNSASSNTLSGSAVRELSAKCR